MLRTEKERRRSRNRWYKRWLHLAKLLKKGNNLEAMHYAWHLVECGHNYSFIAESSHKDLSLVVEDCLNKYCEECEYRFTCFTEK